MDYEISELRSGDYEQVDELYRSGSEDDAAPFSDADGFNRFLERNRGLSLAARSESGLLAVILGSRAPEGGVRNRLKVRDDGVGREELCRRLCDKAYRKLSAVGVHHLRSLSVCAYPNVLDELVVSAVQ